MSETWLGRAVGSCRIDEKIGEGGCGQVFLGVDVMLDRPVAIKVLHPALAAREDVTHRFRSEATTLARLSHPNIATLYSFHQVDSSYVMVMEFVEGRTIEDLLHDGGPMSPGEALPLFLQALEGLHHAHEAGVVHRDIKGSNLMVSPAGLVKVMDFGIARALGTTGITQANAPVGTPEYMSPEQVRGEEIDTRSDIYSLGILLFKMLTGRLPITGKSPFDVMKAQVEGRPRSVRQLVPTVPEAIERAIIRALAKPREERFPTADAMRAALEEAVDAAGYISRPPSREAATPESATQLIDDAPGQPEATVVVAEPTGPVLGPVGPALTRIDMPGVTPVSHRLRSLPSFHSLGVGHAIRSVAVAALIVSVGAGLALDHGSHSVPGANAHAAVRAPEFPLDLGLDVATPPLPEFLRDDARPRRYAATPATPATEKPPIRPAPARRSERSPSRRESASRSTAPALPAAAAPAAADGWVIRR